MTNRKAAHNVPIQRIQSAYPSILAARQNLSSTADSGECHIRELQSRETNQRCGI